MDQEPKLRSIPSGGFAKQSPQRGSDQNRTQLALGVALAIALLLLLWSYFSLGSRIDALEDETRTLRQAVAERDDLITAQRTRLDEVRGRLADVIALLDAPVQSTTPPPEAQPKAEEP